MTADFVRGLKWIGRRPGAGIVSVLCLALGVGASATAFTLLDAAVFRPYQLPGVANLVVLWESDSSRPRDLIEVSLLNFQDWEKRATGFGSMAAFASSHWPGIGRVPGSDAFPIAPRAVSRGFFRTLGAKPLAGRDVNADDVALSVPPPVILSHGLWQTRFGGDANAIGSPLLIDNEEHRVIGVMPRDFAFPDAPDVWISVERTLGRAFAEMPLPQQRMVGVLEVVGRLRAGVSSVDGARELTQIAGALRLEHSPKSAAVAVVSSPFSEFVLGRLGARLWIALAMAAAVLLFASVNVAALRLAHLRERAGELAARLCLGATRARLAGEVAAEGTALVAMSLPAALAVCAGLEAWLRQIPVVEASGIDLAGARPVLIAAAAVLGVVAWIIVSAAPSLVSVQRIDVTDVRLINRTVTRGSRLTASLLIVQAAVAICLVAAAAGAFRAFARLAATDVGFSRSGVTTIDVAVPDWKYSTPAERARLDQRVVAALQQVSGVSAAAGVSIRPFRFGEIADGMPVRRPEDVTVDANNAVAAARVIVTPDYFSAMGIAIREGRSLREQDWRSSPPAVVVSRALAQTLWGGASAIGKRLETFTLSRGWQPNVVVGVAGEVRSRVLELPALEVYVPHGGGGLALGSFVIRHPQAPLTEAVLRAALHAVDGDLALERVQTTADAVNRVLAPSRLLATAMTMTGATGLVLLALGIFGAAATVLRIARRDVAIRQAIGASPFRAARAPLGSMTGALAAGLALGLALAPSALRVVATMGVADVAGAATSLVLASVCVAGAALLAIALTLAPVMKASPSEVLRAE